VAGVWSFLEAPWTPDSWRGHFGYRADLRRELALLEILFPAAWRDSSFATLPFSHRLPYHLATKGGWAKLLDLAAELLRGVVPGEIARDVAIPMAGRLRAGNIYSPTLCEIVIAPVLRAVGEVVWQPQGFDHGADYRVDHPAGILVAEVKRVSTSLRQERVISERTQAFLADVTPGEMRSVFTDAENLTNAREDAKRLRPHVTKAARQLATSARLAAHSASAPGRAVGRVPGVLVLDLDGNNMLRSLRPRIDRWMQRPWASSIDLIVFVDYESCDGVWSTIVEPTFARSRHSLNAFARALWRCRHGHNHVRVRPLA
jgi:hypothetical protein